LVQLDPWAVTEADVVGAFISDEPLPTGNSHDHLHRFVQDLREFDISSLIGKLFDRIEKGDGSQDYYQIMLEFARVPRSVWREVKLRFKLSVDAAKNRKFVRPFRFTFPDSDCTFMIAALPPELSATGGDGERTRLAGLQNLTDAAMYLAKSARAVGILVSKDGEFFQVDWCRLAIPWAPNPEMEAALEKSNPFRPVQEKTLGSFVFADRGIVSAG
jgi:hypothetical protein